MHWKHADLSTMRSVAAAAAAVLPQWDTSGYFWHSWTCCMSAFHPLAPARENRNTSELGSQTASLVALASARLTILFHKAAAMSACPRSLKWKQSWEKYVMSGLPSCRSQHITVCIMWLKGTVFCPKAKCLCIWCTAVTSARWSDGLQYLMERLCFWKTAGLQLQSPLCRRSDLRAPGFQSRSARWIITVALNDTSLIWNDLLVSTNL